MAYAPGTTRSGPGAQLNASFKSAGAVSGPGALSGPGGSNFTFTPTNALNQGEKVAPSYSGPGRAYAQAQPGMSGGPGAMGGGISFTPAGASGGIVCFVSNV